MSNLDSCLVHVAERGGDQATYAELYRQLLDDSLERGASAIHLHYESCGMNVRYRIKDKLHSRTILPIHLGDGLCCAVKLHARIGIGERRRPQDGRDTHQSPDGDRLIHVAIVPASQGPSITLRWVLEDSRCRELHEIGLLPAQQALVEEMLHSRVGFVVVGCCGFSGRRTVGHAILLAAKQAGKEALSLEWGVRRRLPGILQCDFSLRSKLDQWQWIGAALRRNPDLLFVEHPGNFDTIGQVIAAARNNCLIVAAMGRRFEHLIEYLEWLDVPRPVSTTTLLGVVDQRLLPRVCANCAVNYVPKPSELRELRIRCDKTEELSFVKSAGCLACRGTGRDGVVGVHEVATMTESLRDMFLQRKPSESIRQRLLDGGMTTYYESALHKVVTRQIASTTVFAYLRYGLKTPKDLIDIDAATGLCRH
jgi:type II secretory ATPase GspE/PulE/Tfp pilus assembly ATPase PilB-like protein